MGDCEEVCRRLPRHLGSCSHLLACKRGGRMSAEACCPHCLHDLPAQKAGAAISKAARCHPACWLQMPKVICSSPAVQ